MPRCEPAVPAGFCRQPVFLGQYDELGSVLAIDLLHRTTARAGIVSGGVFDRQIRHGRIVHKISQIFSRF